MKSRNKRRARDYQCVTLLNSLEAQWTVLAFETGEVLERFQTAIGLRAAVVVIGIIDGATAAFAGHIAKRAIT